MGRIGTILKMSRPLAASYKTDFTPIGRDLALNALNVNTTAKKYSALAELYFKTTSSSMTVYAQTDGIVGGAFTAAQVGISIFSNGVLLGRISPATNGTDYSSTYSLGAGTKTIKIISGSQQRISDGGTIYGTIPTRVTFADGTSQLYTPHKGKQFVFLTDSIGVGIGSTVYETDGYVTLLRNNHTDYDMPALGYGYKKASATFNTTAAMDSLIQQLHYCMDGASTRKLYIALGINDHSNSTGTPTQVAGWMATGIDAIHSTFADCTVYVQTPTITTAREAANSLGFTLQDMRNSIATLNSGRSYVTIVDGTTLVSSTKLADGTHFTTAGYVDYAASLGTILTF